MSEVILNMVTGITVGLSCSLVTYAIAKHEFSDEKLAEKAMNLLTGMLENPETQQKLYLIGVLFGKGIQQGLNLKGNVSKAGLKGIFGEAVSGFISGITRKLFGGQTEEAPPQHEKLFEYPQS
jgi:hypothetical protein